MLSETAGAVPVPGSDGAVAADAVEGAGAAAGSVSAREGAALVDRQPGLTNMRKKATT
jgi:hypothetical protein